MLLTEYNEAEVMELFKEDGRREGREEERKELMPIIEEKDITTVKAGQTTVRAGQTTLRAGQTVVRAGQTTVRTGSNYSKI